MGQLEEGTAALLITAPEQIKIQGARAIHDQALTARSGLQLLQLPQQLLRSVLPIQQHHSVDEIGLIGWPADWSGTERR